MLIAQVARADSPSVTAVLSNSEAVVGKVVLLEIKVTGANNIHTPDEIPVDGLEIRKTETSKQWEMDNLNTTSSTTYGYSVLPLRAGTFTIPSQTIRVGNRSLQTPELTLNVANAPGGSAGLRPSRAAPNADTTKLWWAEIILPKKDAYVGEAVPAEIRVGIDSSVRFDGQALLVGPEIKVPGLTILKQKASRPAQTVEVSNGRRVNVFVYKVALTAAKLGRLDFPAELTMTMQWPQRRAQRHSPSDIFGMDDGFESFFLGQFNYTDPTEVTIRSDPVGLEVKALPPNAPPGFSGAVGNFTMATEAKPTSVQTGDPITVTSTISGRGNFDRMNAPALEDERGWHTYPPSSKFKQDDDVGISGAKTFETVISPNEKKPTVPPLLFSFFDPAKNKYVTLRSDPIAINVTGNAVAAQTTAVQPGSTTPATAAARATPKPRDILYQMTERGRAATFTPLVARPTFWTAQIIPLIALLGFIGWKIRQRRLGNREARRIAALQHESTDLLRKLRRGELSPQEYFSDASRAVRLKTALAKNVDPSAVDAEMAAAAFALDENSRAQLRWLFERNDELRYSGRPNGDGKVLPNEREEVLGLIESLRT
jgi:hypothetical protein